MIVRLGALGAAIAGLGAVQLPFACSPPPPPKPCVASVSAPQPTQYTTELVYVTTGVANSPTAATAHYRTTSTAQAGRASSRGHITFAFRVRDATAGYKVTVGVSYAVGSQVGRCSTSFTPRAPLHQTALCDNTRRTNSASNVQALFNRFHNAAWGGADGGAGVRLPDGRTLLTFGDTFQDPTGINSDGSRRPDNKFRHNSLMVLTDHCLGALMAAGFSEPLPNNSDGSYYWPGQPSLQRRAGNADGDRLWIPAARVKNTTAGAPFGFSVVGSDMFAFDIELGGSPTFFAKYAMPNLTATTNIHFDSGSYVSGSYLYQFGGRHAEGTFFGSNIYLRRVPLSSVGNLSTYEYFSGRANGRDTWNHDAHVSVLVAGPNAMGSAPSGGVYVAPFKGGFGWVGTPDEYAGDGLHAWTSVTITQTPYARSRLLYHVTSDSRIFRYLGAAHPERALASGRLLAHYSRNSFVGADLIANANLYMPQFVEIPQLVIGAGSTGIAPQLPTPAQSASPQLGTPHAPLQPRVGAPVAPAPRGLSALLKRTS